MLGKKSQPLHLLLSQRKVQVETAAAAAAAAGVADARVVGVTAAAVAAVIAAVAVVAPLDLDGLLAEDGAEGEELLLELLQLQQGLLRRVHLDENTQQVKGTVSREISRGSADGTKMHFFSVSLFWSGPWT